MKCSVNPKIDVEWRRKFFLRQVCSYSGCPSCEICITKKSYPPKMV